MTRMTLNDIEALEVMVEVFGTQQLLDALEAIALHNAKKRRSTIVATYSGNAPLNSVQAHISRDTRAWLDRRQD